MTCVEVELFIHIQVLKYLPIINAAPVITNEH